MELSNDEIALVAKDRIWGVVSALKNAKEPMAYVSNTKLLDALRAAQRDIGRAIELIEHIDSRQEPA